MTQWENVFIMRGLLCSGKVNYTVSLSALTVGAEQNSGHRYELSQQQLKYTVLILVAYSTYSTSYNHCTEIITLQF